MLFSDPFLFSLVCNTQHGQNTTAGKQQSDQQEHIAVIAGLGAFCFLRRLVRLFGLDVYKRQTSIRNPTLARISFNT